ncbi:hypothetical protein MRX96_012199 [Rhipicephalus microplus]
MVWGGIPPASPGPLLDFAQCVWRTPTRLTSAIRHREAMLSASARTLQPHHIETSTALGHLDRAAVSPSTGHPLTRAEAQPRLEERRGVPSTISRWRCRQSAVLSHALSSSPRACHMALHPVPFETAYG